MTRSANRNTAMRERWKDPAWREARISAMKLGREDWEREQRRKETAKQAEPDAQHEEIAPNRKPRS